MTASSHNMLVVAHTVITDLTICFTPHTASDLDQRGWHRMDRDLYLHTSKQSAWLYVSLVEEANLGAEDLVVMDVMVGESPPDPTLDGHWESRPAGIWILKSKVSNRIHRAVTDVDVLFGLDAVDPRPGWTLTRSPLHLNARPNVPVARLSVLCGRAKPGSSARPILRFREDGKFKIVQISDTHMVTGVGVCRDAIDASGDYLPESEADPLTVDFVGEILDVEKPDLVILSGDQLHHDIPDSKSALFKVSEPIIRRSIPFAIVFGNHDSEGVAQLSILQELPLSLCETGPEQIGGVGNYDLQVLAPGLSQLALSTLYFLDSHGQISSKISNPDYKPIQQNQIDWFINASQKRRKARERDHNDSHHNLSLAFFHIPLPEFGDRLLVIHSGQRREPTEGPSFNSHFYNALAKEGVSAVGCGHDHVNDFCALLPPRRQERDGKPSRLGPWLCYGGGTGFGGYCSYGGKRFHRRARVWELDADSGGLRTWLRIQYARDRADELILVECGSVVNSYSNEEKG